MAVGTNARLNRGLTDYSRGRKFVGYVADDLFPTVQVDSLSGTYWDFGDGDFYPEEDGPQALDAAYAEFAYELGTGQFQIGNYGLATRVVDLEEFDAAPEIVLARRKIRRGTRVLTIQKEIRAKTQAYKTGTGGYSTAHNLNQNAAKWDAKTTGVSDHDPRAVVKSAKDLIRKAIGVRGNAIMIPADVELALQSNTFMYENFQYTREGSLTMQSLALQFQIPVENIFLGDAIYISSKKGQAVTKTDIWSGHCVVFYKENMPVADAGGVAEEAGFAARFAPRGWENKRVMEYPLGNPVGTGYTIQYPYQTKVLDYLSGVLLRNCI